MFCVATQDVTERIVREGKKISPKLTTSARSVKISPVDSNPLDGALSAAAFANEGRPGGRIERKSLDIAEQHGGFEFGSLEYGEAIFLENQLHGVYGTFGFTLCDPGNSASCIMKVF